jgi:asparagine synthase (glutamine-hydrolysing)
MCGIFSYQQSAPTERAILEAMLQAIHHRGPDEDGLYLDQPLALGMRRLSIIDLAGGKQPIRNEDGSAVVIFNGEIYNFWRKPMPAPP